MASYTLSSVAGAGAQFFDNNGNVLSGGKIYTYQAGTTSPAATYTDNFGSSANTNPIILDSAGRTPQEIWFPAGQRFKFIIKTSTNVLIGTYDNLPSINDPFAEGSLLSGVTGTNAIAATASPTISDYGTGASYSFIAANTNTGAVTLSIDGLAAKSVTKGGSIALAAGEIQAGMLVYVHYDGTRFQMIGNSVYGGSVTNATITGGTISGAAITGGSLSGLSSDLAISDGGTGASTALAAFNALKQAATDSYVGAVELATSAEAQAGTDTARAITPATLRGGLNASGDAPIYAARAWVNFDGTKDSTGAASTANTNRLIRASGNVTSVLRNGAGDYTITFTTAMPDANYAVNGAVNRSAATYQATVSLHSSTPQTTTGVRVIVGSENIDGDRAYINVAVFR